MSEQKRFGTFGGVFVPNVLTILGVILFLRTGWVVGAVGLTQALLILALANGITLLTSLSLSAVSTNTRVGAGGAYFLISRSLGLEVGGALGVPLYLAQAVSVAFYVIGFAESVEIIWPGVDTGIVAVVTLGALVLVAWVGAELAVKTQYLIFVILGLSLASFFFGLAPLPDWQGNVGPPPEVDYEFWGVFAIFFPAVTGIMAGVSMSGDLRDPAKSIPRGTMLAVVSTGVVYAATMVVMALGATREQLLEDGLVMRRLSVVPQLVFAGLWAATLSSALTSLVAAPRTLQALARDRVVPSILGRGLGLKKEPRVALGMTVVVAVGCLQIGDLNLVAPVISMFFLTTYGMVNLVAGLEGLISNPSYRPTFRVHWALSAIGALGCLAVMLLLDPLATLGAVLVIALIYTFLTRKRFETAWGDIRSGVWFAVTRYGLLRFGASRQHVRNWRPVLLVLVGNPGHRKRLVQFANWIECRRGMLFLGQVFSGEWGRMLRLRDSMQDSMDRFIADNGLSAIGKTVIADDFEDGVTALLQVTGLGEFQPNTVLIGWSDDAIKERQFLRTLRKTLELKKNLLIYDETQRPLSALAYNIDVWWFSRRNFSFLLTLAHLVRLNARWAEHRIRVLRVIRDESGRAEAKEGMAQALQQARIDAKVLVVSSGDRLQDVVAQASGRSGLVFLGLPPDEADEDFDVQARFGPILARLQGHAFLGASWEELELSG